MKRLIIWLVIFLMALSVLSNTYGQQEQDEALAFESEPMQDLVRRKKRCKKLCDLIVDQCVSTGALRVDNNLIIEGNLTVDSIIGNRVINCKLPSGGIDGQALIGKSGSDPVFNFINSSDNSLLFTPGAGALDLRAEMFFGNIARVDQIYGNDATGAVNGLPFLTLNAALSAAQNYLSYGSYDPVVVWVFPGVYEEIITIPDNVGLIGISAGASSGVGGVTIRQLGVGGATTLVTMGENSLLENVSLQLTSSADVALTGISIPTSAILSSIQLRVTNASGGSSNVYGINATGIGANSTVDEAVINVTASGTSSTRGLLVGSTHSIIVNDSTITAQNLDSGPTIGVETNGATGTSAAINASTISAISSGVYADISRGTDTTMSIQATTLATSTANGTFFSSPFSPNSIHWAIYNPTGVRVAQADRFLIPGTAANQDLPSGEGTAPGYIVPQKCIAKNLRVASYEAGPGAGRTTTFTLYKNGLATALAASLVGGGSIRTGSNTTVSIECEESDVLKMYMQNPAGSLLQNPVVALQLY